MNSYETRLTYRLFYRYKIIICHDFGMKINVYVKYIKCNVTYGNQYVNVVMLYYIYYLQYMLVTEEIETKVFVIFCSFFCAPSSQLWVSAGTRQTGFCVDFRIFAHFVIANQLDQLR